jgi:hypothetical protein
MRTDWTRGTRPGEERRINHVVFTHLTGLTVCHRAIFSCIHHTSGRAPSVRIAARSGHSSQLIAAWA